jgi:hypothetical protein
MTPVPIKRTISFRMFKANKIKVRVSVHSLKKMDFTELQKFRIFAPNNFRFSGMKIIS